MSLQLPFTKPKTDTVSNINITKIQFRHRNSDRDKIMLAVIPLFSS